MHTIHHSTLAQKQQLSLDAKVINFDHKTHRISGLGTKVHTYERAETNKHRKIRKRYFAIILREVDCTISACTYVHIACLWFVISRMSKLDFYGCGGQIKLTFNI